MDGWMIKQPIYRSMVRVAALLLVAGLAAEPAQAGLFDLFKRNSDASAPGPTPPAAVSPPGMAQAPGAVPVMTSDAQAAMRMDRLEQQMRSMTGQIEELTYQVRQLQEQLRSQSGGKRAAVPPPPVAAPVPPPANDAIGQAIGSNGTPPVVSDANAPPRDLGQLPVPPGGQPLDLSPPGRGGAAASGSATGSSRADYDAAYDFVLKGDYEVAETSFRQFLVNYPGDPLDADAQYWIGESLYARQDFRGSADAFLAGYQQYPKSAKAPDMLLKLGLSLAGLGQRDAACGTYAEILKKYPKSSNALLQRVKTEQASASC